MFAQPTLIEMGIKSLLGELEGIVTGFAQDDTGQSVAQVRIGLKHILANGLGGQVVQLFAGAKGRRQNLIAIGCGKIMEETGLNIV